jgi:hypothetical protein
MDRYSKKQSFPLLEIAKARSKDPQTSHAAADLANKLGLLKSHKAKILAVLEYATQPLTSSEIALKAGLRFMQVNRRCGELEGQNKIKSDGIRDGQRVWGLI